MLWAIRAQEKKNVTGEKAEAAVEQLRSIQLKELPKRRRKALNRRGPTVIFTVNTTPASTQTDCLEGLNQKICRRTPMTGGFPSGNSALVLVRARSCHVRAPDGGEVHGSIP